jgi:integrase
VVAIRTGLRSGEELGMAWSDVDFTTRQVRVSHALQRMGGAYSLVEPKSRSRRVIELDDETVQALQEERGAQAAAQLAAGRRWKPSIPGLVWTTQNGEPRNATSLTHSFQEALAAAALPHLRWHDLRAADPGLLLAAKVDISVVSKMLGHSSVTLTSRHYAGVSEALKRQASDSLALLLAPGPA